MNNYKFTKENNPRSFIQAYASLQDAQAFADSYDGGGWNVEDLGAVPTKSADELLQADIEFLKGLMASFIIQNRQAGITSAEAAELLTAFNSIKQLSEVGAVPEVYGSIQALVTPIARVYTAERQTADLQKIADYLATR